MVFHYDCSIFTTIFLFLQIFEFISVILKNLWLTYFKIQSYRFHLIEKFNKYNCYKSEVISYSFEIKRLKSKSKIY